ncbi:methylated-DNA--[protein]-cysteine S-methyltransferase [Hydrogenophaga crassostreae]|uniref:methylated-DNA--[protein]-cysteine S-methyltransferase n=1 Tax=Hydrogenophaga crassostreae TaxID=1763535 RepID=UPI001E4295D2|nr:methylated-DNA--[protein]-cysteine S-methyltransferase [Hydrogenophaga crassostreae]
MFDTAIGRCGVAWGPQGLLAVQLPEMSDGGTTRRLLKSAGASFPLSDGPPMVAQAIEGIQALLRGEPRDLCELSLDLSRLTEFQRKVYAIARAIAPGHTRTYGEVALELGDVKLARAVGQALGHNPFAPVVPCHRVLAAGNRPGGFSATGGAATKLRMLAIEGAVLSETRPLFD